VRFEGIEVWGPEAGQSDSPAREALYLDLWDSYLEPA
jgi:hypothetical protein